MKKSIFLRSAFILLVLALAATTVFAANTTLAFYAAGATGTSVSKPVAKWSIKVGAVAGVGGQEIANATATKETLTASIPLFDTILDTNTMRAEETHVKGTGTPNKPEFIAPGTMGDFGSLAVRNASDVTANIKLVLTSVSLGTVPIKFYKASAPTVAITPTNYVVAQADVAPGADLSVAAADLYWVWDFANGTGDPMTLGTPGYVSDTALGVAATSASTVTANFEIIAVQVD